MRHAIGRGEIALRLGAGANIVYEDRTRNGGERAGLMGDALGTRAVAALPAADLEAVLALHVRGPWLVVASGGPTAELFDGGVHSGFVAGIAHRMAAVSSRTALIVALASCGKLQGIGGEAPPLATMQVEAATDPGAAGEQLRVALVWGMQWLPEVLCTGILPPESPDAAAALAAGCRDPFGFVPLRVEANVAVTPGVPTAIELEDLPASDVLVGDITARVAYGSFVLYDDRDSTGNLELARPNRIPDMGSDAGSGSDYGTTLTDVVHGASFLTMTMPDQRVGYREGAFVESASSTSALRLRRSAAGVLDPRRGRASRRRPPIAATALAGTAAAGGSGRPAARPRPPRRSSRSRSRGPRRRPRSRAPRTRPIRACGTASRPRRPRTSPIARPRACTCRRSTARPPRSS